MQIIIYTLKYRIMTSWIYLIRWNLLILSKPVIVCLLIFPFPFIIRSCLTYSELCTTATVYINLSTLFNLNSLTLSPECDLVTTRGGPYMGICVPWSCSIQTIISIISFVASCMIQISESSIKKLLVLIQYIFPLENK